ncbi:GGDEF domain-containing protein [Cetobacterium sp. ZWU0022]|uniref:GGDEF domain-containing protein n=1 Tax=Cetobacterium sp. ZWU0022 TaxID=1340502 RepID=UPI000648C1DA|nr:GGDEF domain-containing protein [Cetobacterium sp. ZWU0022]
MKSNFKFYLFFLIIFSNICFGNTFNLGIQDYPDTNKKIDGTSINDIIIEIFEKELKLKPVFIKGEWKKSYQNLDTGKIDALGLVNKPSQNIFLSRPIFNENLYITSDTKPLKSINDLNNKIIYSYRDDKESLDKLRYFLDKNNITAKIVLVNNTTKYRDDYYLNSEFTSLRSKNKLFVSYLGPVSIGVNKIHKDLIPKINKLLDEKYGDMITEHLLNLTLYYQQENFKKSLTSEEYEWLKNKKELSVFLESNTTLSRYIKSHKKYIGILPEYISLISKIIETPIVISSRDSKSSALKNLTNKNYDFLTSSEEHDFLSEFLISNKIDYIPVFLLNNHKKKTTSIGVINKAFSQKVGETYFSSNEIKIFSSSEELQKSFLKGDVRYIITPFLGYDNDYLDEYREKKIKDIPLNFIVKKDNKILLNILNKALDVIDEESRIKIKETIEKDRRMLLYSYNKKQKNEFLIFFVIILTCGYLSFKIISQRKTATKLKHDQLTGLQNRFIFDKIMKSPHKNDHNIFIVIDLDNFKSANDTFGHQIGDLILIEVAKLLLDTFEKREIFRISGDEFYIHCSNKFILKKLNNIVANGQNSEILKQYNISFSIGYYEKAIDENFSVAFDKADKAMYAAKKISGFSFVKFQNKKGHQI